MKISTNLINKTIMAKNNKINTDAYTGNYSDESFKDKVKRVGQKMGGKLLFNALALYYVLKSPDVPLKVKGVITGALGYVICPLDLIPDIIPVGGYTDDLAALTVAVQTARAHITPEIQRKAEEKVYAIFGSMDDCNLVA